MPNLTPPSAALLPPVPLLRERLAVALREVDFLRRLIRAADSVRPPAIPGPGLSRRTDDGAEGGVSCRG